MQLKIRADEPSRNMLVVLDRKAVCTFRLGVVFSMMFHFKKSPPRMVQLYHLLLGSMFLDSIFLYASVIFQDFGAVVIVTFPKVL